MQSANLIRQLKHNQAEGIDIYLIVNLSFLLRRADPLLLGAEVHGRTHDP
jgi:hypothetical protein